MIEYKVVVSKTGLNELDLNKFGKDRWSLTTALLAEHCLYYYFQREKESN